MITRTVASIPWSALTGVACLILGVDLWAVPVLVFVVALCCMWPTRRRRTNDRNQQMLRTISARR